MLSYSKNQKVKGSGYVMDIPDNFTIKKGAEGRDFIAYIPNPDDPEDYFESDFIIFAGQPQEAEVISQFKTMAEFFAIGEAMNAVADVKLGEEDAEHYARRDLPGVIIYSLDQLPPHVNPALHVNILVVIDDHIQMMRLQILDVTKQDTAKYKKAVREILDHMRADKPVTLLTEPDAEKYIAMSADSKTVTEWNGLIQEYIDHIGIARDIQQNMIVNSFSNNPVGGFDKFKKDIKQMLKNISGDVDRELVKAEAVYTLKRAEYPNSPSLKGMKAVLNNLIDFANQKVDLLGENVEVKSSIASGIKVRLNKPVADVIDIISGNKSELNKNVKSALRKAKQKNEKSAAGKSSGAKEKAPSKAGSNQKKESGAPRELEYLPPELLDALEIMCKCKMNRAKAEDVQELLRLSSLLEAAKLLDALTKKDYLTKELESGGCYYTPNENARAILYHTARQRRERRQKRLAAEKEAEQKATEWSIMIERNKKAVQSCLARVDEYKKLVDAEVAEREVELRSKSQQNIDTIEKKRLACEKKLGELGLFSFSEKKSTKEEIARLQSESDAEKKKLEEEIGSLYASGTDAVKFYKRRVNDFLENRYNIYVGTKKRSLSSLEGHTLREIFSEYLSEHYKINQLSGAKQALAQIEKIEQQEKLLDLMADGKKRQVMDIVEPLDLTSTQKASAILNQLVSVSLLTKSEKNGVHYYKLSDDIYERLDELLEKAHSPYARYADNPKFSQLECPAIPNPKVTV